MFKAVWLTFSKSRIFISPVEKGFKVFVWLPLAGLYWSIYEAVGDVETVFFGDKPVLSNAWVNLEIGCGDAIFFLAIV